MNVWLRGAISCNRRSKGGRGLRVALYRWGTVHRMFVRRRDHDDGQGRRAWERVCGLRGRGLGLEQG